jgi:Asp-tRNA(Asn)/Glu-tRNA(Gln) amidotransferase A subunit family amidase
MAIGQLTHATTDELFEEALEMAKRVDERIAARAEATDKSTPGVLEGNPISVKDCFDQRGVDNTCGLAARCFRPKEADGLIISLLREAGAIPFVRTNVPQALMLPESMNVIYGTTANPWNMERTPGGSSGGEAALLAARGSVLGVGSDIGGSLRIPAHYCGVYSFKPTPARLTLHGLANPASDQSYGQDLIRPVAGPLAHSVDDLLLMLRAWMVDRMWEEDVHLPRVEWNEALITGPSPKSKLKIGYFESDGWFDPAPSLFLVLSPILL